MKQDKIKFIRQGIIFCILFILVFYLLNAAYSTAILSNTIMERIDLQFKENIKDTPVLFMGASHTANAINPSLIQNSFNLANGGTNYIQIYYKLKKVLNSTESPIKIIVLPIDPNSFSPYFAKRFNNEWYWKKYIDFKKISENSTNISSFKKIVKSYFPLFDSGENLISFIFIKKKAELIKGYAPQTGNFSSHPAKSKDASQRIKKHLAYSENVNQNAFKHFKKILELSKKKKIYVILVKYPLTEEFVIEAKKYLDFEEFYKSISAETEKFNNCYILDYQKFFLNKYDLFKNSDHLNKWGAEILSKQVAKDLEKIKLNIILNNQISDFIKQK